MMHFDFISKDPREDNSGLYTVMSDDPGCKFLIVDLSRFEDEGGENDNTLIYDQTDGTGSRYYYKVTLLDSIEPMTQEEKIHVIELCWDWWLSYYLL